VREILVVGPGYSTNIYKKQIVKFVNAHPSMGIFSWSMSYTYCLDHLGIEPTYWSFIDPHGALPVIDRMVSKGTYTKTIALLFDPVVTTSYKEQLQHIGTTQMGSCKKQYAKYVDKLYHLVLYFVVLQLSYVLSLDLNLYDKEHL